MLLRKIELSKISAAIHNIAIIYKSHHYLSDEKGNTKTYPARTTSDLQNLSSWAATSKRRREKSYLAEQDTM